MDVAELKDQFVDGLNEIGDKVTTFFEFVGNKLAHFSELSVGEQIAYGCVLLGVVLVITGIIMFFVVWRGVCIIPLFCQSYLNNWLNLLSN